MAVCIAIYRKSDHTFSTVKLVQEPLLVLVARLNLSASLHVVLLHHSSA